MSRPRYLRTAHARCIKTAGTHLYVFVGHKQGHGYKDSGVSLKHHRRDRLWRHVTFHVLHKHDEDGTWLVTFEFVTHLSRVLTGGRVLRSKRYLRFKVCL